MTSSGLATLGMETGYHEKRLRYEQLKLQRCFFASKPHSKLDVLWTIGSVSHGTRTPWEPHMQPRAWDTFQMLISIWDLQTQSRNTGITNQFRHEVNWSKSVEGRHYFVGQQDAMCPRCPVFSTRIFVWYRNLYPQRHGRGLELISLVCATVFSLFPRWQGSQLVLATLFLRSHVNSDNQMFSRRWTKDLIWQTDITCVIVAIEGLQAWACAHLSSILPDPQLLDAPRMDSINCRIDFLGCCRVQTFYRIPIWNLG